MMQAGGASTAAYVAPWTVPFAWSEEDYSPTWVAGPGWVNVMLPGVDMLSPTEARQFAAAYLRAADEADGMASPSAPST